MQSCDLAQFTNISKIILEKNEGSLKERYARYNQGKFMNKKLAKSNYQLFQVKAEATRASYKR